MASYHLIDTYLDTLARQLNWRGDHHDVASELRDHLYCAVERLEAEGVDLNHAQHRVLDSFGDPSVVTAAFVTSGSRGLALPTVFTTSAGRTAYLGCTAWLLLAGAWIVSQVLDGDGEWGTAARASYQVGWVSLLVAATATTTVLVALDSRHGGLGVVGRLGAALAGLGAVASILGWFIAGWGLLLGLGALLISVAVIRRGLAPRAPAVLLGASWVSAIALFVVLEEVIGLGTADEWGDHRWARVVATSVGSVGMAAGLWGIGRWLGAERPVSVDVVEPTLPVPESRRF